MSGAKIDPFCQTIILLHSNFVCENTNKFRLHLCFKSGAIEIHCKSIPQDGIYSIISPLSLINS